MSDAQIPLDLGAAPADSPAVTAGLQAVSHELPSLHPSPCGPQPGQTRAVCIGGGTGQPNSIRALRMLDCYVTAVVSMVDDGGSTGILRAKTGIVPPGDIRKCLVAMADESRLTLARAFEHRFPFADNHTLGNLMITALTEQTGSFMEAVDTCSELLGCHGAVLPSTLDNVVLCGRTRDGMEFRGQASLGTGPCALSKVWLSPRDPVAYEPAVQAILDADIVVLGPGSLFTSILPNVLVGGIRDALRATSATRVFVCSTADMQGETWGLTAEEHVDALLSHGLEGAVDVALIHRPVFRDMGVPTRSFQALTKEQVSADARRRAQGLAPNVDNDPDPDWYFRPVQLTDEMVRDIEQRIPTVVVREFAGGEYPTWHNLDKLAGMLRGVLDTCRSRPR